MKPHDRSTSVSESQNEMTALIRALETPPAVHVPADFAARVTRRLPAQRRQSFPLSKRSGLRVRALTPRYGMAAAMLAVIALLVLFALVPGHTGSGSLQTCAEMLLSTQFLGIALWLGMMRWHLR